MKVIAAAAVAALLSAGTAQAVTFDISATFAAPVDGVSSFTGTVGWDGGTATHTPQNLFDGHDYDPAVLSLTTNLGAVTGTGFARVEDAGTGGTLLPHDEIEITINSFTGVSWIGLTMRLGAPGFDDVISDHTDPHLLAVDPVNWTVEEIIITDSGFGAGIPSTSSVEYEFSGGGGGPSTPVPVPAAAPLALLGLGALAMVGRRRRG